MIEELSHMQHLIPFKQLLHERKVILHLNMFLAYTIQSFLKKGLTSHEVLILKLKIDRSVAVRVEVLMISKEALIELGQDRIKVEQLLLNLIGIKESVFLINVDGLIRI